MGLQNLKSAFANLVDSSEIEGRHSESPIETIPIVPSSILEATTYAYDSIADEPIDLDGGMAPADFPLMADLFNNPETTTTLNDPSSDVRFQAGIGFPSPNIKAVTSGDGFEASLAYVRSATGDMFVASGAVTSLGKISDVLGNVGIDTPNFDFGAALDSVIPPDPQPQFLKYENTVEELFNPGKQGALAPNLTDEFVNTGNPDSTRGIAFQVLGDKNKSGDSPPDFRYQDKVQNEKNVSYISPIRSFTPGNIELKEDYFENISDSLGDLASAVTPDFIEDGLDFMGNKIQDGIEFISENVRIQELFSGLGGAFPNIGGFGKRIPVPKFPSLDIDFSKIGNFFKGSIGGGFLGDIGKSLSDIGNGISDKVSQLADTIQDVAGPIGNAAKDLAANLNPLDEFKLPQIDLQNPRQVSVTDYGGQAIFKKNSPRALSRKITIRTTSPFETADKAFVEKDVSTPYSKLGDIKYTGAVNVPKAYYPNASMDEKAGGDKMTIAPVLGPSLSKYDERGGPDFIDSEANGMPFFFKDLRNNTYLIFRGYLEGITDTPSPNWSEQNYIGRSESNWIYTGTSREISFNFKVAAQTAAELVAIYQKLNKLTGLTYPEYKADQFLQTGNVLNNGERQPLFKTRMKPPLARLRVGDLFGSPSGPTKDGILGFIKNLSYTVPDESPWEVRKGQRVPKIIDINCGWQVIHEQVPDMNYPYFYGYNPVQNEEQTVDNKTNLTAAQTAGG